MSSVPEWYQKRGFKENFWSLGGLEAFQNGIRSVDFRRTSGRLEGWRRPKMVSEAWILGALQVAWRVGGVPKWYQKRGF